MVLRFALLALAGSDLNGILIRRHIARKEYEFNGEHYWEIGCKGTLVKDVVKKIKVAGFKIEKQYRLPKHAWHCFFILDVNKGLPNED